MRQENDLGKDPIGKLVLRIALPSMLAQFVNVLYSIVDRIFIGNIADVGELALAGVGICGPVITMIGSVAALVGIGGAPLMSIRMGEGKQEKAKEIVANCFLMLCALSVLLIFILLPIKKQMLMFFGASEVTIPYAERYFSIYLMGTMFALLSTGMSQFIICQGFAKKAMFATILGAGMNIVLDPIFIFGLHLGVAGAAIATVLSQFASCFFVLAFLFGKKPAIPITFGGYRLRIMKHVLSVGFSPFAIIALDNIMIIAMNAVLQKYGGAAQGDMLVVCATIAQSFMLVVTMPLGGISGGTQTILSYNYGAKQIDRVKEAQRKIFFLCLAYTGLMTLVAWLGGHIFVGLFTKDAVIAEKAVWAIRVCTIFLLPLGIQYEIVDGFTAIGEVKFALPLSSWRKFTYFVTLFTLPIFFGAQAAFYAEPVSDILGPLVSIIVYLPMMKRVLKKEGCFFKNLMKMITIRKVCKNETYLMECKWNQSLCTKGFYGLF